MGRTPTQALASLKLGRDVVEWATEMRGEGQPSYRTISRELHRITGVDVTDETIRLWLNQDQERAAS